MEPATISKKRYATPDFFKKRYTLKDLEEMHTWDLALLALKHEFVTEETIFEWNMKTDRPFYMNLLKSYLVKEERKITPKFDRDYFLSKDLSSKKMLKDLDDLKARSYIKKSGYFADESSSSSEDHWGK